MLRVLQSEIYRIRKSRLFCLCLLLSLFFTLSLAFTFHYDTVRVPMRAGIAVVPSLTKFTEFLFSDYSLVFPLTLFLALHCTEDYHNGVPGVLLSKGVDRRELFWGKLLAAGVGTLFYLVISFVPAYCLLLVLWAGQPVFECSVPSIIHFLLLQSCCYLGFTVFLWLSGLLLRLRSVAVLVDFCLLGVLYLYPTKIGTALGLEHALYRCWIVGCSHEMQIDGLAGQTPQILTTAFLYLAIGTVLSYWVYARMDLRKMEGR